MKTRIKILLCLAAAILLLVSTAVPVSAAPLKKAVTFPDPVLEGYIRAALGIPAGSDIRVSDLQALTTLIANGGVRDLSGLEYCTNLEELQLSQNAINDISPLSRLKNLKELYLWRTQVTDLKPLRNLTSLEVLILGETGGITDISPLSRLVNLKALALNESYITDIKPLTRLTNLQGLDLQWNYVSDISPLVNNSGIGEGDTIRLMHNRLDLSPGSRNMTDIQTLIDRGATVYYETQGNPP